MADNLRDFFVSIGFKLDTAAAKKAVAGHAKVQKDMTDDEKKEIAKRERAEKEELDRRDKRRASAEKRFQERTEKTTEGVKGLGKTAVVTALAIAGIELSAKGVAAAVDHAAKSFERLGYASRRAGASAASTTAFGYAASQLGSDSGTAESALAGFGQNLKMYKGYRDALQNLIGNINGPDGKLQDTGTLATRLGVKLKQVQQTQGPANAMAQAGLFGFDDYDLLQSMMNPSFAGREAARRGQMGAVGANTDAAAAASTAFEQSLRHIVSVVDDIGTKIETSLTANLGPQLDKLAEWATRNGAKIADFVTLIATGITDLAIAIAKSGIVKESLKGIADSLQSFTKFVGSDEFKAGVKTFVDDVVAMAKALRSGLEWLGIIPSSGSTAALATSGGSGGVPVSAVEAGLMGTMHAAYRGRSSLPEATRQAAGGKLARYKGKANPEVVAYMRSAFAAQGVDPDVALRVFDREGLNGFDPNKPMNTGDFGTSFGPWQMHYGGSGIPGQNSSGLGDVFNRQTGLDARDPKNWKAVTDWVARYVRKHGWNDWHGRIPAKVGTWDGVGTYKAPLAQAQTTTRAAVQALQSPYGGLDRGAFGPLGGNTTNAGGDLSVTNAPVFNINGTSPLISVETARLQASRGLKDTLRNAQGAMQ